MEKYLEFFRENDHFARHCGIELLQVTPGAARVRMPVRDFHLNGAGTVHGGALFTLADFAFAVAVNSRGKLALAINTSMSFINPAFAGTLYAQAQEISSNRRLGVYQVEIEDEQGQLVARFEGTAYRKDKPLLKDGDGQIVANKV